MIGRSISVVPTILTDDQMQGLPNTVVPADLPFSRDWISF